MWQTIWEQHDYEERLEIEAELMITLEALRDSTVDIENRVTDLVDCVD